MGEKRWECCYSGNRGEDQRLEEVYKRDNIQKLKEGENERWRKGGRVVCRKDQSRVSSKTCPSASESALEGGGGALLK